MLHKLCSVQLGPLYDGDVMSQCDSLWILKPCHIGGIMRCINLWWIKYDVTDGLNIKKIFCNINHVQNDPRLVISFLITFQPHCGVALSIKHNDSGESHLWPLV